MYGTAKCVILVLVAFLLVACGGGGGGGGSGQSGDRTSPGDGTVDQPPAPTDTTAPSGYTVAFSAEFVDQNNQRNLGFALSNAESGALYSYSITSSAGGSPVSGSGTATQATVNVSGLDVSGLEDGTLSISIALRDAAGNTGLPATDTVEKGTGTGLVQISGLLTFDLISQSPRSGALNYNNIQAVPIRGAVVEALGRDGTLLASGESDDTGVYRLLVPVDTEAQLRVKAQIRRFGTSYWDVSVTDNTSDNALYVLAGSFADTGAEDSSRDLHASSGWGGGAYTETRSAAPFSILYYLYDALERLEQVQPGLDLGNLEIRWSVKNNPAEGRIADGDLGSSFYRSDDAIYLLGKENVDTEEYDPFVILHEFTHFLQHVLSRDDSIGGSHNVRQFLDMRVAFSEGLANAIAAMLLDDPLYRDTGGPQQQGTLAFFDIEQNSSDSQGWFVERSVHSVVYDLYDADIDGVDAIALGMKPILAVLMADDFTGSPWFISIYSFLDQLRADLPEIGGDLSVVKALAEGQLIFGVGSNGVGESNTGGTSGVLPVYKQVVSSGAPTIVCSSDRNGFYNKLGNRSFSSLLIDQGGRYTLRMERVSGKTQRDPDFIVNSFASNRVQQVFDGDGTDLEVGSMDLMPGQYIIEAYDYFNSDADFDDGLSGYACYEFSVVPG